MMIINNSVAKYNQSVQLTIKVWLHSNTKTRAKWQKCLLNLNGKRINLQSRYDRWLLIDSRGKKLEELQKQNPYCSINVILVSRRLGDPKKGSTKKGYSHDQLELNHVAQGRIKLILKSLRAICSHIKSKLHVDFKTPFLNWNVPRY